MTDRDGPLSGVTALDFGHTVMGPCAGLILADLGCDVIKIEPPQGDPTRRLKGFGIGYFGYFNRNKRSLAIDLKGEQGHEIVMRLVACADVLIENFAPGTMDRLGLSYEAVRERNPRLIYASLKGFLPGPYEYRPALDEVVQMMAGLAYMTGPSGRPLRAGTSIVDITGGMFAVIGVLAALRERERTGAGRPVTAALFETAVFLMGQHLCYAAQVAGAVPPMPERVSAWAVYETFAARDGRQIFVGITTDNHWQRLCASIGREDLAKDPALATNNLRIQARPKLIPLLTGIFGALTLEEAIALCERSRIPFAPIAHPEDLLDDPHLNATGGLLSTRLPDGRNAKLPRIPIGWEGQELGLRRDPPQIGEHSQEILAGLGYSPREIDALMAGGVVAAPR